MARGRIPGRHLAVLITSKGSSSQGIVNLRESTNLAQNAHSCLYTPFLSISVLKTAQPRPGGCDWRAREWGHQQEVGASVTPMPWPPLHGSRKPYRRQLEESQGLRFPVVHIKNLCFLIDPPLFTAAVLATWDGISEAASTFLGPPTWFP